MTSSATTPAAPRTAAEAERPTHEPDGPFCERCGEMFPVLSWDGALWLCARCAESPADPAIDRDVIAWFVGLDLPPLAESPREMAIRHTISRHRP